MSVRSVYLKNSAQIKKTQAELAMLGSFVPVAAHAAAALQSITGILEVECAVPGADPDAPLPMSSHLCTVYNAHRAQIHQVTGLLSLFGKHQWMEQLNLLVRELDASCPV